ncbi:hypothetical protein V1502_15155 [Bacillus sp. SCS-153A]|uniref:hypothetical protein n=1 Tax=Rossellomorea sedimentorum TaxID=3115294 RepID=UPI0039064F96
MSKAVEKRKKWTDEEEKIVTETVLKFLREGKTQKDAFDEASKSIGRTSAACSFRWNNKLKKETVTAPNHTDTAPASPSLEDCITFLQTMSPGGQDDFHENKNLREQQKELQKKLLAAEENYNKLKTDYKELLALLDMEGLTTAPPSSI